MVIKIGQEVYVKSLDMIGKVVYVDYPWLFHDHMNPIQLRLEEPYYDDKHEVRRANTYMYRTGLKDLKILKE